MEEGEGEVEAHWGQSSPVWDGLLPPPHPSVQEEAIQLAAEPCSPSLSLWSASARELPRLHSCQEVGPLLLQPHAGHTQLGLHGLH